MQKKLQIVMFAKYTTGAVELFPCLCATAAAHTIFEEGLFLAPFGARGNIMPTSEKITRFKCFSPLKKNLFTKL